MLNYVPIDAVATFDVVTHDPDTGSVHDADSVPVYDVFEDANDTPILSAQATTKRTSKTGNYRGTFTVSAANGFEADKSYNVVASATVTGTVSAVAITAKKVALTFRCGLAVSVAGVPKADTGYFAGQTITAAAGVTVPTSIASPTNITAGTMTTTTNLTTNNDKTGYTISNAGIDSILDRSAGVETGFTLRQALRLMLSSVVAKLSGANTTTVSIRDINDTKDRIVATVDASGNRSAVSTDVT